MSIIFLLFTAFFFNPRLVEIAIIWIRAIPPTGSPISNLSTAVVHSPPTTRVLLQLRSWSLLCLQLSNGFQFHSELYSELLSCFSYLQIVCLQLACLLLPPIAHCSHSCIIPGLILGCFTHVHLSLEYFSSDGFTRVNLITFTFLSLFQACFSDVISNSQFSSVHSVVSNSLLPHGLQHTRFPCPSPTPGTYSNSYPLSQWCHPTITSSVVPFSSCIQSFPALGSFQMSQFFTSGVQSTGVSASASVLPMNIQDWFSIGWTGWSSLQSKRLSRVFSNTTVQKHQFSVLSFLFSPTLTSIHDYWKNHKFDKIDLCWKTNVSAFK